MIQRFTSSRVYVCLGWTNVEVAHKRLNSQINNEQRGGMNESKKNSRHMLGKDCKGEENPQTSTVTKDFAHHMKKIEKKSK